MRKVSAAEAYDRLAPVYDRFNADNSYEHWLGDVLIPHMSKHGLRGDRVLDVGCGTGRAFLPLLSRGWEVFGCDISDGMLRQARAKFRTSRIHLRAGNAVALDTYPQPFDLILALNDLVNYLTEDGDLECAFEGMRRNLAPHGVLCFDANTLGLYESEWLAGSSGPMSQRGWEWTGLTDEAEVGGTFEMELSAEGADASIHRQRHWPRSAIEAAMDASGLRCLAVLGQREGGDGRIVLEEPQGEAAYYKLIYMGAPARP
jgi:SAM-dependent methyltransferase